jgi:hypothetical protein
MWKEAGMEFITTVRVLVKETRVPLVNVSVELFDRDENSPDDSLGLVRTNRFGEAVFKYETADFADNVVGADDQPLGLINRDTVPDLYPVIYNSRDEIVVDKRDEATRNEAKLHLLVLVEEVLVNEHQLGDVSTAS